MAFDMVKKPWKIEAWETISHDFSCDFFHAIFSHGFHVDFT